MGNDLALGREVAEGVYRELKKMSRAPFQRMLARILGCAPSTEAITAFAEKHPDRWAQAVAIFGPLAGFQKDVGPTINVYNIERLSDAELLAKARALGIPLEAANGPAPAPAEAPKLLTYKGEGE